MHWVRKESWLLWNGCFRKVLLVRWRGIVGHTVETTQPVDECYERRILVLLELDLLVAKIELYNDLQFIVKISPSDEIFFLKV